MLSQSLHFSKKQMLTSIVPEWMKKYGKEQDDENKGDENKQSISETEPVYVANLSDFNNTDRKTVHVKEIDKNGKENDRPLIIIKVLNKFYALDLRCYHAGGPLSMGDIEDIEGNVCIKCPWHNYIIKLDTGEGLYYGYDPIKKKKTGLQSKGKKQRKHKVIVDKKTNKLYVILNKDEKEYGSDQYAKKLNDLDEGPTINLRGKGGKKKS
eukprot:291113_1